MKDDQFLHTNCLLVREATEFVFIKNGSNICDLSKEMTYQLIYLQVVAELGTADMSGSTNDLGLAPGGTVKLIKSSSLSPDSSNK